MSWATILCDSLRWHSQSLIAEKLREPTTKKSLKFFTETLAEWKCKTPEARGNGLTDAARLGDVGVGEWGTGPLGEATSEGAAVLDVAEDLFVLKYKGFVEVEVLVYELVLLRRRLVLRSLGRRRAFLRRRRSRAFASVVAHCWEREASGFGVLEERAERKWDSRQFWGQLILYTREFPFFSFLFFLKLKNTVVLNVWGIFVFFFFWIERSSFSFLMF